MAPRYTVSSRDGSLQWPRVPSGDAATVLALHAQNERSQWLSAEALQAQQFGQLRGLLKHCLDTVPYYRESLAACIDTEAPLDREAWRRLPILTRSDLQQHSAALESDAPPASHGRISSMQSSGSTGKPVRFKTSGVASLFYYANNLRHFRWHEYDPAARYAGITRLNAAQQKLAAARKPVPWMMGYSTGPFFYFDVMRTIEEQATWLNEIRPQLLTTYPSNLKYFLTIVRRMISIFPSSMP